MTESRTLERRYRRLLALYPKNFRRAREEEMLSVLMAGARDGQRWPRPAEAVNLLCHAAPSRWALLMLVVVGGARLPRRPYRRLHARRGGEPPSPT